jgi:Ca-activated chloride channel family protein
MPLAFSNPIALVFLSFGAIAWYVTRHSLADLSVFRRRLSLAIRLVILACLVLSLAGTQILLRSTKMCVLFVADLSDSVTPRDAITSPGSVSVVQDDIRERFIKEALKGKEQSDVGGVILFGSEAFVDAPPDVAPLVDFQTVLNPAFTDVAQAIRLAISAFPEGYQKRIVLLSDGNENLGSAEDEAAMARANQVRIDVFPLRPPEGAEVLLDKMIVPGHVKIGEPFEAKVVATARQDCDAMLTLERDGEMIRRERVSLVKGKNVLPFSESLKQPRFATFRATIESDADTIAENNEALGFTFVKGKPRVLYVEGDPGEEGYLSGALEWEQINTDVRRPSAIPSELAEFQKYDSIILSDVSAFAMSDRQLAMIRSLVRDLGVGLVMIGGEDAFGAGGYLGTPVEEALPVRMDITNKKFIPAGAVVLVMHSMEFPQGDPWARTTCEAVLDTLNKFDKMGVLHYAYSEAWLFPLQRVQNKARLRGLIRNLTTGDMPDYGTTLQMAYNSLAADNASAKHIILLSDGDAQPPGATLVNKIKQAKITISTVCIGPHGGAGNRDWTFMQGLAAACGGRSYLVVSGKEIPRIFIREAKLVRRTSVVEEPFFPKPTDGAASDDILKGIDIPTPQLQGYVPTTGKSRANTSLVSQHGDPVLSSWQFGLGRSVAFTSDCKRRWGAFWLDWPGYQKFWAQAVRWTMRREQPGTYDTMVDIDRGRGQIAVDAIDEDGEFVNFLDIKATVVKPTMESADVTLEQTGPGRYEARFSARDVGQYLVHMRYTSPDDESVAQTAGAVVPYSPEFKDLEANEFLLSRLTDITGGRQLKEASDVFALRRTRASHSEEIWRTLLIIALCLLPLDIAIRRIMFDKQELAKAREQVYGMAQAVRDRTRRRATDHEPGLARLLSRKAQVSEQREGGLDEDVLTVAGPQAPPTPAHAAPPPPEPEALAEEAPVDTFARLRAAKERARQRREGEEEQ